jgi:hypothetical protein
MQQFLNPMTVDSDEIPFNGMLEMVFLCFLLVVSGHFQTVAVPYIGWCS